VCGGGRGGGGAGHGSALSCTPSAGWGGWVGGGVGGIFAGWGKHPRILSICSQGLPAGAQLFSGTQPLKRTFGLMYTATKIKSNGL
jgi:hypothetical protein